MTRNIGIRALALVFFLAVATCLGSLSAGESTTGITSEQAREIALEQTGGGDIIEMNLRHGKYGRLYFRMVIRSDSDLFIAQVDATTGELVQFIKKRGLRGYRDIKDSLRYRDIAPSPVPIPEPSTGKALTMEEALAIALQHTNGGTVVESEVDTKRRIGVIYEFEIVNNGTKYEIEIAAADGSLLEFKQKRGRYYSAVPAPTAPATQPNTSAPAPAYSRSKIDATNAQKMALEKVGGGNITEYKLDTEKGRLVHEVTVITGSRRYELEVDDDSGMVRERSIKYLD